jgi:hypothetical protein
MARRQASQPWKPIVCGTSLEPVSTHIARFKRDWSTTIRQIASACPLAAEQCAALLKLDPLDPRNDACHWCRRGAHPALERSAHSGRNVGTGYSFLRSAMKNTRVPTKITLDAYAASHRAVREMKEDGELPVRVKVRSSQYLNNLVEQDHRRVKQRIRPMLGFKRFDNAVVGIELAEKVKNGQFKTGKLGGCYAAMTELWNAALAA